MQTPEEYEVTERIRSILNMLKKRRGMTKKAVSEKLGIGLTTLDDYLNGVSSFRLGTLIKLADIARIRLSDILDGTEAFTQQYDKEVQIKNSKPLEDVKTDENS
jgi:transcriptional regulator with XRE-family HTH domain